MSDTAESEVTYETSKFNVDEHGTPKQKSWLSRQIKLHAYVGETVLLVGVMSLINIAFMPAQPGFLGIEPNPYWVVILLMLTRYGFRAGLLSSLLCGVVYMVLVATRISEDVIALRDLMSWQYAKPAVLFVLVGVAGGMLVQRHKNRLEKLEEEAITLIKDNKALKRGEEELRDVNVELANRVVGATDTLPMLYKYAKKLNNLDTEQILTVLTELVVEVTHAGQASVYQVKGNQLPLHARNGKDITGPELKLEPGLFESLVVKRETVSLHDLLSRNIQRKDLFLCGPLAEGVGGKVIALLAIEELEFLRYNPATIRLFSVIVDWACASLDKAAQYQDKPDEKRQLLAKKTMIRAQRATMAPGMASAGQVAAAAGVVDAGAKPDHAVEPAATVVSELPSSMPAMLATGPLAQAGTGAGLGDLLKGAESSLFDEMASQSATGATVDHEQEDPADRSLLQHMLSGELQIASAQGNPLAKLLTEIDGYMMARKGGGD